MMRRTPLKRSTPLRPKTPMKRSAPMKKRSRPRRPEGYSDPAALRAVKGEPCYLRVPGVCLGEAGRDTVVPCHSNSSEHGKGKGLKARDEFTVPGCHACHAWLDQGPAPRDVRRAVFAAAYARWVPARAEKLGRSA